MTNVGCSRCAPSVSMHQRTASLVRTYVGTTASSVTPVSLGPRTHRHAIGDGGSRDDAALVQDRDVVGKLFNLVEVCVVSSTVVPSAPHSNWYR